LQRVLRCSRRWKWHAGSAVLPGIAQESEESSPIQNLRSARSEILVVDGVECGSKAEGTLRQRTKDVTEDIQRWKEALRHHRTALLAVLDSSRVHVRRHPERSQPVEHVANHLVRTPAVSGHLDHVDHREHESAARLENHLD